MRIVREGWKPSLRDASCWSLEVMKGGVGWRRRSFFSTLVTVQVAPSRPASTSSRVADGEKFYGLITKIDLINYLRKQLP